MSFVVALVGRPNVGKSTLFNFLTRTRDALVADMPGLTRDRKYGVARYGDVPFTVIDTGGLSGEEDGDSVDVLMAKQVQLAVDEADAVWLLVDGRAGLSAQDHNIAQYLRSRGKPVLLVVNKIDGVDANAASAEFFELGLGEPALIAAAHGRGVRSLVEDFVVAHPDFQPAPEEDDEERRKGGIKVAVIGRPNVGKSTLINRIIGEERVVAYDRPGTTRDSVLVPFERDGKPYTLIDTAGVRRRKNVREAVEKFSIIKTLKAIDDSNVAIMVFDAQAGIADQDAHLVGYALEKGRALVVAINKWDGLDSDIKERVKSEFARKFPYLDFVRVHFISALHGSGVGLLFKAVNEAYAAAVITMPTARLTQILEDAQVQHQPPLHRGRRIKLRYAHQGGQNPPIIVIHGNQTASLPDAYRRYLMNIYRQVFNLFGTPIRIELRSGDNPFEGRTRQRPLTERQQRKKQRLKKFGKKQARRKN